MASARQIFAASLLGRLPIGITGLAILLLMQTSSGSFALGGAAAGCYVTGLALVAPTLGRLIDRHGPWRVLTACSVVFPCALFVLVSTSGRAELAWTTSALLAGVGIGLAAGGVMLEHLPAAGALGAGAMAALVAAAGARFVLSR